MRGGRGMQGGPGMGYGMEPDMMDMDMMGMGMSQQYQNTDLGKPTTFDDETGAFGALYLENFTDSNIKFVGINTNKITDTKTIVSMLMNNNWPWAQIIAKDQARQFASISSDKPFMAIVDRSGTVKYAGSAYGFVPKMMLAKVTGTKLQSYQTPAPVAEVTPAPAPAVRPTARPVPVRPTTARPPVTATGKKAPRELEDFEKFQAEKELGVVRDLFLAKRSNRLITPKRGIDMAREIMRKYPDTQYAIDAQTLLRENVDPRYRTRYNLTDEELGL